MYNACQQLLNQHCTKISKHWYWICPVLMLATAAWFIAEMVNRGQYIDQNDAYLADWRHQSNVSDPTLTNGTEVTSCKSEYGALTDAACKDDLALAWAMCQTLYDNFCENLGTIHTISAKSLIPMMIFLIAFAGCCTSFPGMKYINMMLRTCGCTEMPELDVELADMSPERDDRHSASDGGAGGEYVAVMTGVSPLYLPPEEPDANTQEQQEGERKSWDNAR